MSDREEQDPGPDTVSLGRFNALHLPVILDALRARGIFAMTKSPLEKAENEAYAIFGQSREILLVERARAAEARQIIDTEVRAQVGEMSGSLEADGDIDFEGEGLVPIGWLEPEVARELMRRLADAGIRAEPEYALDAPPPPYARADGRVRVHVEGIFVDEAAEVVENDVREALVARGITPTDPMIGEDE
ncbi:MAG: hypothetical protein E6G68_04175 [Actinobacteria bacterium]|nr:MAG: hypothetical protein E6G68_04175 [Actinomycetota bacterium]